MKKWKYFTEKEIAGLEEDIIYKLDRAREFFGKPIIITSGYRTVKENKDIGGVPNSAHVFGLAVDIACGDLKDHKRLLWALGAAGFRRVGSYSAHIHVDVDHHKPTPAFWTGESK